MEDSFVTRLEGKNMPGKSRKMSVHLPVASIAFPFENFSLITPVCVTSRVPTFLLNVDGDDESKLKRGWREDLNVPFGRKIKGECVSLGGTRMCILNVTRVFYKFLYFCRLSPLKDL